MSVRLAVREDAARLEGFLLQHADGSMFPLGNLRQHGAVPTDHFRSMSFWIAEMDGQIAGAIGISQEGFVFPQMPEPDRPLTTAMHRSIVGRQLQGIIGPSEQAHRLIRDLGLSAAPVRHMGDEPQYGLDLQNLTLPDTVDLQLVELKEGHRDLVTEWRIQFMREVIGSGPQTAREKAVADVEGFLAMNTHRLLLRSGDPVSMTGFNSALPEIVQIGAVFTPPAFRRQGLARAAVAMHLSEAREHGVRRAVLSAANTSAARAYEAIGFRRIGDTSMIIFDGPQQVGPCPV